MKKKKITKRKIPKKKTGVKIKRLKRKLSFFPLAVIVILIILTGVFIYVNSVEKPLMFSQLKKSDAPLENPLAAVVNGEEISISELNKRYNILPDSYKQVISKEDVLKQLIDELLLVQEAKKKGISVNESEIDAQINNLLEQNNMEYEDLVNALAQRGLTIEDLKAFYVKERLISSLLKEEVFSKIVLKDTDIKDYYYRNKELFTIPETRNVSHILICHNESVRCYAKRTKEEAYSLAKEVKEKINSTNFEKMAFVYSDEPSVNNTFGRLGLITKETPFIPEFLNVSFSLKEGEVSEPLETVFGYHIIRVNEIINESVLELEEVYDQINLTLTRERQQEEYNEYIKNLRGRANIINYLEKNS